MSHTPGPWELLDGRNIKTINGIFYLAYGCDEHSKMPFFFPKGWSELDANAKLTAAAPELLKALTNLMDQLECVGIATNSRDIDWTEAEALDRDYGQWHGTEGMSFNEARKAIAKATGGS